ncbi:unnamed protein product [Moneuplotes crassus]|uniref:Uncharacterized protein n=1 Tax=Euplotes crassus TaxID=5936 RepID=A0AAD2D4R5_EUPCR|nr:unnamed protein product [Moneuplotes crassus]
MDDLVEEDIDIIMKVIVVGDGRIGKTNLITRFARNKFSQEYKKTLGVDFLQTEKFIKEHGQEIQFYIWDTAGQEEYDALTRKYYKGASACILAFSTEDQTSFNNVKRWKEKVDNECGDIAMALVQTKIDLKDTQPFTDEEVEQLSSDLGIKLFLTCSKDNINVSEVFEYLGNTFLTNKQNKGASQAVESQDKKKKEENIRLGVAPAKKQKKGKGGWFKCNVS